MDIGVPDDNGRLEIYCEYHDHCNMQVGHRRDKASVGGMPPTPTAILYGALDNGAEYCTDSRYYTCIRDEDSDLIDLEEDYHTNTPEVLVYSMQQLYSRALQVSNGHRESILAD